MNDGHLQIDGPKFTSRGEWDDCNMKNQDHEWVVVAFYENTSPGAGLAICKKCAELSTGWVTHE